MAKLPKPNKTVEYTHYSSIDPIAFMLIMFVIVFLIISQ